MPRLLEDLAEETSAGNRRAADRMEAEARSPDARRQDAVESARQATAYAVARVPQVEGVYRSALARLRNSPTGDTADHLLRVLLDVFESGRRLLRSARGLWEIAEQTGAPPERLDDLTRAERRLGELAGEVQRALDHRAGAKEPADPERLALGLRQARAGKAVKADEARAWFRPPSAGDEA